MPSKRRWRHARRSASIAAESLLKQVSQTGIDVKVDRGGIRDIEFLVQCLQRVYGGSESWLRSRGTLFALQKLHDKEHISGKDFHNLTNAYEFLRNLEHRLQLRHGQQTHRLPRVARGTARPGAQPDARRRSGAHAGRICRACAAAHGSGAGDLSARHLSRANARIRMRASSSCSRRVAATPENTYSQMMQQAGGRLAATARDRFARRTCRNTRAAISTAF